MRRTLWFLFGVVSLTHSATAQLQHNPKASTFGIEESRVFIEGKTRQSFWNIKNNSQQNYFYIVEVVDVDNHLNATKKSARFLVTPPSGVLKPEENKALRVVRVKDDLSEQTETFSLLRLKLIPSFKSSEEKTRVQTMVTIFAKLFYRPEKIAVPDAINKAVSTLKYRHSKAQLIINNPSPYWLTLSSVKVNGVALTAENKKAWMVGPGADLPIPYRGVPHNVTVRTIQENGIATMDRVVSTGDKI